MIDTPRYYIMYLFVRLFMKLEVKKQYKLHFWQKRRYDLLTSFEIGYTITEKYSEFVFAQEKLHLLGKLNFFKNEFDMHGADTHYFNLPEKYYNLTKRGIDLKIKVEINVIEQEAIAFLYYRKDQYAKLKLMGGFDED